MSFALVVHKRIAADHSILQMQVDMATGGERREITALRMHQFIGIDALSFMADALDP